MTKSHTTWSCETCGARYETAQEAVACEALPLVGDTGALVGDFVVMRVDRHAQSRAVPSGSRALIERTHIVRADAPGGTVHEFRIYVRPLVPFSETVRLTGDEYLVIAKTIAKEEPPHAT